MERSDPESLSGWLLSAGLALAVAGVVVQTTAHLVQAFVAPSLDYLNADRDGNVFAWASSVAIFGAAFAALVLYGLRRRRGLLVLALALAFFSLDDIAAIHERLALHAEDLLGLADYSRRAVWVVLFMPLLVIVTALLVSIAREASPPHAGSCSSAWRFLSSPSRQRRRAT
jgi:hypothetical protein